MQVRHSRTSLHSDGDGLDQLPHDVFLSPYAKVSLACFGHDFHKALTASSTTTRTHTQ